MSRYAEGTRVPVERSKAEIESLLRKHGASQVASSWDSAERGGQVACKLHGRMLRWRVQVPADFTVAKAGARGRKPDTERALEVEEARRWRALLLLIKAKLEMIESGGAAFEEEFLANIMLPNGGTVADEVVPHVEKVYATGKHIPLLLADATRK